MKGYFGRLLEVDLSSRVVEYTQLRDDVLESALGGKGLGVRLLLERNPTGVDALDRENVIVIATGPATGTTMWGQNRYAVFSKSPATGGYGESYCGGSLAPKIKGCGVDALLIRGRAEELTTLAVGEEGVTFRSAEPLRGRDTWETERAVLSGSPKGAGAMVIGPAGENGVRFACIKSDRWRSLGRGGMGAVMGSKNLKAVVFSGGKKAELADPGMLRALVKEIAAEHRDSPVTENYTRFGTASQVRVTNSQKCFPTRYWTSGAFEGWERLSADYMQEHFDVEPRACPPCFLRCTNHSRVREGRHRGLELEGPEYETIYAIGGLNAVESLEEVAFLNDLCDRLGMDTMSAGNIAGLAVEAYRRGATDFAIDYNQPDRMAELFRMIAADRGLGRVFGGGIVHASRELGLEDAAVHVKGLEPAGFDPRVLKGMGLAYATAARGACHLRGTFYKPELSGEIDRDRIEGKAEFLIDYEDRAALFDCLILCRFYRDFVRWDELARLIEATTGMRLSKERLQWTANRITQQSRAYNGREGIGEAADGLPARLLDTPNAEGATVTTAELERLVADYNRIRRDREAG